MSRLLADARRWMTEGTELLVSAVSGLDEAAYDAASLLPGWTRRHLVAHVAANAEAVGNLVHWIAPLSSMKERGGSSLGLGPADVDFSGSGNGFRAGVCAVPGSMAGP